MAVRFNAETDGYQATVNVAAGSSFTITCWAYLSADRNAFSTIFELASSTSNYMQIATDATGTTLGVHASDGDDLDGISMTVGAWHRVAITVTNTGYVLYTGAATGALTVTPGTLTAFTAKTTLRLGKSVFSGEWFNGRIAAVKSWAAALTAEQIEAEFSQYQPLVELGSITRWHPLFTHDLVDYSGRGNTLTIGTTTPTTEDGPPLRYARSRGPRVTLSAAPAIELVGIPSGEALGEPTISAAPANVTASGIPTGEAIGVPHLTLTVSPPAIPTGEAVGSPTVVVAGVIAPPGIPGAEAVGTPSLVVSSVAVSTVGIPTGEALGSPHLQLTLRPSGIVSVEAVGQPTLTPGPATVQLAGIPTGEAFGAAVIATGAVAVGPAGIPSAAAVGTPRLSFTIYPSGIGTGEGVGAPTLISGPVAVLLVGIGSGEAFGTPEITVTLDPAARGGQRQPRSTPLYELLLYARIPRASGPPTFDEVDVIPWKGLKWGSTLSRPQNLTATCDVVSISDEIAQVLRGPDRRPCELWLTRNGKQVFAGPLRYGRRRGNELDLDADGLLAYLQHMFVFADLRFAGVDQFAIVAALIDHWQNSPYGHFGIDTTTVGGSGRVRDQTYERAERNEIARRVEELGRRRDGFDTEIDPATRQLQLWYPGKGVDRSSGEDAIVFDSRNIDGQDATFSIGPDVFASDAFGASTSPSTDTTLWSEQFDADLRAAYGRVGAFESFDDITEQSTLDDHVGALLDARNQAMRTPGRKVRVTPDSDLDSYDVGDTVSYEIDSLLRVGGAFRIRSRQVTVDANGVEAVDLEFV